jgi:hypothetical protein
MTHHKKKDYDDCAEPRKTIPKEPRNMTGAGGMMHATIHVIDSPHEMRGKVHHRGDEDVRVARNYGLTRAESALPYMLASKNPAAIRTTGFE